MTCIVPIRPEETPSEMLQTWAARRAQLGARIRELRLDRELSQEALALEAGLSRNMLIGIEWGRRSIAYERLWDIAEALAVPVEQLLQTPQRPLTRTTFRGGRKAMGK
jgi:transcriptional regulator with XRE-family HTH domain